LAWGPLSELYGRKKPLFFGFFAFAIFQIGVATAQNVYTIMLCRFFSGTFGAAPLAIVGGMYVDFWSMADRGVATNCYAGAVFLGPIAGPIAGEYITRSYLGWRWTAWLTLIISMAAGIFGFIVVPETFAPVLLQQKAERLRHETKNWALHAPLDEHPINIKTLTQKYFFKPLVMLVQEPIVSFNLIIWSHL
jgi:DHA1 family multidrug resistance protein-like MFS transporter